MLQMIIGLENRSAMLLFASKVYKLLLDWDVDNASPDFSALLPILF